MRLIPFMPPPLQIYDLWSALKAYLAIQEIAPTEIESKFQKLLNRNFVLFTNSGRAAIKLIIETLELPADTEILVPAYTCIVVPEAIMTTGHKIKFVDIDRNTGNVNLDTLKRNYSPNTKILILTHMFGFMSDTERITEWAKSKNIFVIEDAALALGSTYNDQPAGSFGDVSMSSFNIGKQITAFGGGIIATNNRELFNQLQSKLNEQKEMAGGLKLLLKTFAYWLLFQKWLYSWAYKFIKTYKSVGENGMSDTGNRRDMTELRKIDRLRLALIDSQLDRFAEQTENRRALYAFYKRKLSNIGSVELFKKDKLCQPAPSHYSILLDKSKDVAEIIEQAQNAGIRLGRVFDYACPSKLKVIGKEFTNSRKVAERIINIPFFPGLTFRERDYIINILTSILARV